MNEELTYSITTFSSKGILSQCERALTAAKNGALSVGIRATNGVVLASLKKVPSPLVKKEQVNKIEKVCEGIIGTFSGLSGDFRLAIEIAREIAVDYYKVFGVFPYIDTFMKEFSKVIQEKTQKGGLRPIGCLCIFGGYAPIKKEIHADENAQAIIVDTDKEILQPLLYQIDPSGSIKSCFSTAMGVGFKECSQQVQKRTNAETEIHDAVIIAVMALKDNVETALTHMDIDICTQTLDKTAKYSPEEVQEILRSIHSDDH
ncbi:20S proteasome subunit alpha 2 [Nematocida sp. AWRm80]|nr:20S proteasome subunit alpha 2 [Nematocida sp. AWRm80]